jgi:pyruvate dehydrogenase E2 component (dihydrolipoamide acetyltransferase)
MSDALEALGGKASIPPVNFSEFGEVQSVPLTRIQQIAGARLSRNWVTIPHVTHGDELDWSAMDAIKPRWESEHAGVKFTPVLALAKAIVEALKRFPIFNSSLEADGKNVILKRFFNIGIAVDSVKGLVVPVLRGCDNKSLKEIALDLNALVTKANAGRLSMAEMSGSSITLSSLGHIGGTGFTPIINAPDVAILGICRAIEKPVRDPQGQIQWRRYIPICLSYDHRVINGADAARFTRFIDESLVPLASAWSESGPATCSSQAPNY